jgi:hypothetical protein
MKSLKNLKDWNSPEELYNHCKTVVLEKDSYSKIRVQEALQLIDEYLSNKTTSLIENKTGVKDLFPFQIEVDAPYYDFEEFDSVDFNHETELFPELEIVISGKITVRWIDEEPKFYGIEKIEIKFWNDGDEIKVSEELLNEIEKSLEFEFKY